MIDDRGIAHGYGKLLIATGGRNRRLQVPGAELPGIHYLRTVAECDAIKHEAVAGRRAVVVGMGFIGCEVAASALYAENWLLIVNSVDYLARDSSDSPLQHFWAMSIQGQFYIIWLILASTVISAGNAVVRKIFNVSSNAYLEVQWYLFAAAFLLAAGYTLLHGEHDRIANAANLSALVFNTLPGVNWAGFYFFDGTELVVGPFQGLPACVRIPLDKGVCGAAASSRQTQRIDDVDAFPGHIACDSASRSELVIPLLQGDTLVGVFDIDSPEPARFDVEDQEGLEAIARIWVESLS